MLKPNNDKGTVSDELPAHILKEIAEQISPLIAYIFQQSYNTEHMPTDWSKEQLSGIYKNIDKSSPNN